MSDEQGFSIRYKHDALAQKSELEVRYDVIGPVVYSEEEIIAELDRRAAIALEKSLPTPHCSGCFEGCAICKPMKDDGPSIRELRKLLS